ncbi:MAG: diadenylate cyclase [Planctomycetota bacterium]|nr:diadenylate cyclase [Planctomycetota bacterium]
MSRIIPSHWGSQSAFRTEIQTLASAIFEELDPRLQPEVLLLGLVADHEDGVYPLFLDTQGGESSSTLFTEASRRAKAIRKELYKDAKKDEGKKPEGDTKRTIVLEAWRRAVEEALEASDKERDVISFCSSPRPVKEFLVCTVLRLNRGAWKSRYALRKNDIDRRERRPESLLDATVEQFMRRCIVGMAEHHSGLSASMVDADPEEILRAAGRLVTDAPALGAQRDLNLRGLWHAANTISSLRYEGQSSRGQILISVPEHDAIVCKVRFQRPVPMSDHVAVRKLLETHQPGYSLLSDGNTIYGLGHENLMSSIPDRNLFNVGFLQHYTWELAYGLRPLMRVSYGHPRLPEASLRRDVFAELVGRVFGDLPREQVESLWALAEAATRQEHGTLLVISENAVSEAQRLAQQSARITPTQIDEAGVLALTAVDGALLADPSATVHAFSVILDGQASTKANPARGARYNSALRYVHASEVPCLAVVVSEDGTVDFVS